MKYIDAEKLKERLEDMKQAEYENCGGVNSKTGALQEVQELIESLQEEQTPTEREIAEAHRYAEMIRERDKARIQQEQPNKYETALEKARKWMPNVNQGGHAILIDIFPELGEGLDPRYGGRKQEQPEVDLEKEIDNFLNETGAPYVWCNDDEQKEWCNIIARHFYKLGLNARKEQPKPSGYDKALLEVKSLVDKLYDEASIGLNEYDSGLYNGIAETCMKLRGFIKARLDSDEQPEVDLEKELIFYHNEHFSPCENDVLFSERTGRELDYSDYEDIARHFAEWGAIHLNARKEK